MRPIHSLVAALTLQKSVVATKHLELFHRVNTHKAKGTDSDSPAAASLSSPPSSAEAHPEIVGRITYHSEEGPAHAAAELFKRLNSRAGTGAGRTVTVTYAGENLKTTSKNLTKRAESPGLFKVSSRPSDLWQKRDPSNPDLGKREEDLVLLALWESELEGEGAAAAGEGSFIAFEQAQLRSMSALQSGMDSSLLADAGAAEVAVAADSVAAAEAGGAAAAAETAVLCPPCFAVAAAVLVVALVATSVIVAPFMISKAWDKKREKFTQANVNFMMGIVDRNATVAAMGIDAVACYNKEYDVSDWGHVLGKVSRKLKSGLLHTDYDCMFLKSPVSFWTRAEGGFQNLAYSYHGDACQYDHGTGDLWCHGKGKK